MSTDMTRDKAAPPHALSGEGNAINSYRLHLLLIEEEAGDYSAIVLNLPGTGSCGATEAEAIANATDAFRDVLDATTADGESIPWKDTVEVNLPAGARQMWIVVDA